MPILCGRVALVTGASRGIGRAVALALADEGACVAIAYREGLAEATEVAQRIERKGGTAMLVACDVRSASSVDRVIKQTDSWFGRLDILVNAAGVALWLDALEASEDQYDLQFATNVKGVFLLSQAAARVMRNAGKGRIITVTSLSARVVDPELVVYGASKAAAEMLIRGLAAALGPYNITVNAVAPGTIPTDMNARRLADPERRQALVESTALRRLGSPENVASAVVFLASDEAAYITGATIDVNGGFLH